MTTKEKRAKRAAAMAARYVAGETLKEIGASYGLTHERVRQIITKTLPADARLRAKREHMKQTGAKRKPRVRRACERCGQVFESIPSLHQRFCSFSCINRKYTREDLLLHLQQLADRLGKTPTLRGINRHGPPHHDVYARHFGSLTAAQAAAGFVPNERGKPANLIDSNP